MAPNSPPDRTKPTPREIYYAARQAAAALPPEEREQVLELIRRGNKGAPVHHEVLEYFQKYPRLRDWLKQALFLSGTLRGYAPLPGQPGPIPARSLWVCPQCGFQWRVLRKGRPVPPCPYDGSPLVPADEVRHDG